jgi:hypothetical protein
VSDGWGLECAVLGEAMETVGGLGVLSFELGRFWGQASGGSPGLSLLAEATPLFFFDKSF